MNDHDYRYIDMRIRGIAEAGAKGRWALVALCIACSLQAVVVWNYTGSWISLMAASVKNHGFGVAPITGEVKSCIANNAQCIANSAVGELQKELIKMWVESLYFDLPVVGVKASVADTAIIGGIALIILTIWHYHAVRRENHMVRDLFYEAYKFFDRYQKRYMYHSVVSTQLFTKISDSDEVYSVFEKKRTGHKSAVATLITGVVFLMPAITQFFVVGMDLHSLFYSSVFRVSGDPLYKVVGIDAYARIVIGLFFLVLISYMTWRNFSFQRGTQYMLREALSLKWNATEPDSAHDIGGTPRRMKSSPENETTRRAETQPEVGMDLASISTDKKSP